MGVPVTPAGPPGSSSRRYSVGFGGLSKNISQSADLPGVSDAGLETSVGAEPASNFAGGIGVPAASVSLMAAGSHPASLISRATPTFPIFTRIAMYAFFDHAVLPIGP